MAMRKTMDMKRTILMMVLACMSVGMGIRAQEAAVEVTKNAANYGFRPDAKASDNVAALQRAVGDGGTVLIDVAGTYEVDKEVVLKSNTTVIFGANTVVRKTADCSVFINEGAFSRTFDENIAIVGLHLDCNNHEARFYENAYGLLGHIAMFYVRNLSIDGFHVDNLPSASFGIHVCTFENIRITNCYIEGRKDGIHLGRGKGFYIAHCWFKTFDDPIALNGHDYPISNPEIGWIENGLIDDCYDLADEERGTTGFFARILAGGWKDWEEGQEYQYNGDVCVSDGKIYRTTAGDPYGKGKQLARASSKPTHESGSVTGEDGLTWTFQQSQGVGYTAGVRNVVFSNIHLQKPRITALSIHFDRDGWSRSYYPGSTIPVQENLVFENIFVEAELKSLIVAVTPVNSIKIVNSIIDNCKACDLISLDPSSGIEYGKTHILLSGVTFRGHGTQTIVNADQRTASLKVVGSIVENDDYKAVVGRGVDVLFSDMDVYSTYSTSPLRYSPSGW